MTARRDLPLIPLIRDHHSARDPLLLATWHAALSNAVGVELPHSLLALWLYPAGGSVQLLAPEELAQDNLAVPIPNPSLSESQLATVAGAVRRAYPSVLCLPIRFGRRDVGLMVMADLNPDRYGEGERCLAIQVAGALAPTFAKLARRWVTGRGERDFVAAVTAAWGDARSPRDFFRLVSQALDSELPHDLLEVLIPAPGPGDQYRLAGHAGPPPWADPTLVLPRDHIDLASLFAGESVVRLADATTNAAWPGSLFAEDIPPGQAIRSVLATRVMAGGHLAAHLVVGSTVADLYHADDLELIQDLGRLLAPQIEAYVLASQMHVLRKQLGTPQNGPVHRARVADMLATTPKLADATRRLADEVRAMVPCDRDRDGPRAGVTPRAGRRRHRDPEADRADRAAPCHRTDRRRAVDHRARHRRDQPGGRSPASAAGGHRGAAYRACAARRADAGLPRPRLAAGRSLARSRSTPPVDGRSRLSAAGSEAWC